MIQESRGQVGFSRTVQALVALGAGFAVGILARGSSAPWVGDLVEGITAIGQLWVAAIRALVLPLVVSLTLAAIVGVKKDASIGTLGIKTPLLFLAMLVTVGLITFVVTGPLVALYPMDAGEVASLKSATLSGQIPDPAPEPATLAGRLVGLVPKNILRSASGDEVLPVLLFAVFFALGVNRLKPERSEPIKRLVLALSDTMMVLVGWILKLLPLGVFGLCVDFAFRIGLQVTGIVATWVVLVSALLLAGTLLLYPVTAVLGRASVRRFARAVAPAQFVAVSARSSLASLPALVEGGQKHLNLSPSATGFVLPLSVSVFKLNRAISSPAQLLFLAHVFGVPLGFHRIATFFAIQLILSFSTAGIPSVGTVRGIPAYMAAGIPIEGIFLLNAVETIPDIFKTLINVTADMSAATILSRRDRAPVAADTARAPQNGAARLSP